MTAGVINVCFNLFFVIVCHLGVAGVGLATVIAEYISAALIIRCLMRSQGCCHLDLHQLGIVKGKLRQIMQIGLPAGMQGVVFFTIQCIDSVIHQFLWFHGHGRQYGLYEYRKLYLYIHEYFSADRYEFYKPELWRRRGKTNSQGAVYMSGTGDICRSYFSVWVHGLPETSCCPFIHRISM